VARVQNPTLFSTYFGVAASELDVAGLIDPFIDVDTQLFIDPVLLEKSSNRTIATDGVRSLQESLWQLRPIDQQLRSQG
jgi:hypothetical protein